MSNQRIILVQFVKLSLLEEKDGIEMILFNLPKQFLERCKRCPSALGNLDSSLVVIGITRSVSLFIPDILGFEEIETLFILPFRFLRQDSLSLCCGEEEVVGSRG